jgi:hypothetical protein
VYHRSSPCPRSGSAGNNGYPNTLRAASGKESQSACCTWRLLAGNSPHEWGKSMIT